MFRKESLFEIFQTVNDKKIDLGLFLILLLTTFIYKFILLKYYFLDLVTNLFETAASELKIKSYVTLLENYLNFLLWNWYLKYFTFKVIY